MLKKRALRKMLLTTFSVFTLLVICVIPSKVEENYLNPKIDIEYVTSLGTNEIYLLGSNKYLVKTNVLLNEQTIETKIKSIIKR